MRTWVVLMLVSLALAGCGDDGGDDPTGTTTSSTDTQDPGINEPEPVSLEISTTGTYPVDPGYSKQSMQVIAGSMVEVVFHNEDPNPAVVHDWVVDGVEGAATEMVGSGESSTVSFRAPSEPGEYAFYCSVGDHRDAGMEGSLVVV